MNGGHDCYVGYTMSRGKGLGDVLYEINENIKQNQELNENQLHIVNTMQEQIYDLMAIQYDAGYMNLDIKAHNLLVNRDNNIQIIDSGATDFTHDINELLVDIGDNDFKRVLIIFAQQLVVTFNIILYARNIYEKYKFKILPTAIKNLKELGKNTNTKEIADYLITIKDNKTYSYSYMFNKYGHAEGAHNRTKEQHDNYLREMVSFVFRKFEKLK